MVPSLAFVGGLVVDSRRLKFHVADPTYRVNRIWEEAENRWVNRLTIEPQTFCGLTEKTGRYNEKTNSV